VHNLNVCVVLACVFTSVCIAVGRDDRMYDLCMTDRVYVVAVNFM
jgi:hypothetical protein